MMTIEDLPENSPFNTQEWIEFLHEEAKAKGLSYFNLVEILSKCSAEEYQAFQKKFIKKYKEKYG